MLRNYKGISVDGFIAIYRMIYNLVFFKGEEKKSVLTHSPDAYYLDSIFPKDEERIKKEFGGKIPEDVSFYDLKYLYKLDENTIINFFLYNEKDTFQFYIDKSYNLGKLFHNTESHIDIFINDTLFNEKDGNKEDIEKDWYFSKHGFVNLMTNVFAYFFGNIIDRESIVALITEVILKGGYSEIGYSFEYIMHVKTNPFHYPVSSVEAEENYLKNLDTIVKKYADMDIVKLFLDPSVNPGNLDSNLFANALIDYLNEISIITLEYQTSKPKPV